MYVVAKELVGVPGMPATTKGIREALQRYVGGMSELTRRRSGTKAIEYSVDCLPEVTQKAIRERYIAQLMEAETPQEPAKPVVRRRRDPDAISPLEAYRGSPQLMEERLNALTENQWRVADARAALVREVFLLEDQGNIGRLKAINYVVSKARSGELPPLLQAAAVTANAKRGSGRTISRDPLQGPAMFTGVVVLPKMSFCGSYYHDNDIIC